MSLQAALAAFPGFGISLVKFQLKQALRSPLKRARFTLFIRPPSAEALG
jgi:hypothetical protein